LGGIRKMEQLLKEEKYNGYSIKTYKFGEKNNLNAYQIRVSKDDEIIFDKKFKTADNKEELLEKLKAQIDKKEQCELQHEDQEADEINDGLSIKK